MRIRTRLLLLVLAVWLPAVVGIALLAQSTYQREAAAVRERVEQTAQSVNFAVEAELDKRAVLARSLAASIAVRDDDIERFHAEATAATQGVDGWAFLVDRTDQITNTLVRFAPASRTPRVEGAPWVSGSPAVYFSERGPVTGNPVVAVFAPEAYVAPARYNVGVSFMPAVIQTILEQHTYPAGSVAAVMDQEQRLIARSRDPAKWLGKSATGDVKRRAQARQEGFAESVTLDGVPSLSYLTLPNRYGWAAVIGLPQAALAQAARRVALQAIAASAALLILGLGFALFGARRISRPLLALREAAAQLGEDIVPPKLATGVTEVDQVSAALHEAGLKSHEATRTLELRIAAAVQESRDAQARLLDAQKHEAIGRLAGGIAHDFNNLLQTISTGHHVLDRFIAEGPQRRVLQGAMRATAKAADLIRQMLTFGRAQPLQPQPVDLADIVLKSRELTAKAVGERVTLSASIAPDLPALFVDPTQLELALLNLVFNARDAMPEGGKVTIVGRVPEPEEIASLPPGRYVCVEVIDDGHGMDAQTLARAFEPYFTTKPVGAGSGLGLPQAQGLARQSGGEIRIASEVGKGTRVTLLLPACEHAAEPLAAAPSAAMPARPLKILMVEDDMLVASVVAPALESEGHQVSVCSTADDAVALLAKGGALDILFTDVVMPGRMTGMDLVAWCRIHRPGLPAVVATGYSAQQTEIAVPVLRKPYGMGELVAALQSAAAEPQAAA